MKKKIGSKLVTSEGVKTLLNLASYLKQIPQLLYHIHPFISFLTKTALCQLIIFVFTSCTSSILLRFWWFCFYLNVRWAHFQIITNLSKSKQNWLLPWGKNNNKVTQFCTNTLRYEVGKLRHNKKDLALIQFNTYATSIWKCRLGKFGSLMLIHVEIIW